MSFTGRLKTMVAPNNGLQATLRRTRLRQVTVSTRLTRLKPSVGRLAVGFRSFAQ